MAKDPAWLAQQSARLQTFKDSVENHLSAAPPPSFTSADFPELGSSKIPSKPVGSSPRPWGAARTVPKASLQQSAERSASGAASAPISKQPKRLVAKMGNVRFEEHFEDLHLGYDYSQDCIEDDDI